MASTEDTVADDKTQPAQDQRLISIAEDYEVRYWTSLLDCTEDELRMAVEAAGQSVEAVRGYLQMNRY